MTHLNMIYDKMDSVKSLSTTMPKNHMGGVTLSLNCKQQSDTIF